MPKGMRILLIIFLSLINQFVFGQTDFTKDSIVAFSLNLTIKYAPQLDIKSYSIDNNGNVRCMLLINQGQIRDTIFDKRIKLDKTAFKRVKRKIVKLKLWKLPITFDAPDITDGSIYELNIYCNETRIFLEGQNREQVEKPFKVLLEFLDKVVQKD